jgi:hypothetical protein
MIAAMLNAVAPFVELVFITVSSTSPVKLEQKKL